MAPWFNYIEPVLCLNINLGGPNLICLAMGGHKPIWLRARNPACVCLSARGLSVYCETQRDLSPPLWGRRISLWEADDILTRAHTHTCARTQETGRKDWRCRMEKSVLFWKLPVLSYGFSGTLVHAVNCSHRSCIRRRLSVSCRLCIGKLLSIFIEQEVVCQNKMSFNAVIFFHEVVSEIL